MKKLKHLLMACAMLGSAAGAWAQTDGKYYLYDSADGLFLTRGDNWGTRAALGPGGCPFEWSTEAKTIKFFDFNNTLFCTNDETPLPYTDGSANNQWEFEAVEGGGYRLKNIAKSRYLSKTTPTNALYYHYSVTTTENAEDAIVWNLLTVDEYNSKLENDMPKLNYNHVISNANLTCTADEFVTTLTSDDYKAVNVTNRVASSVLTSGEWNTNTETGRAVPNDWAGCEVFERHGVLTRTVTGLIPGIYKVSLDGFERSNDYATCNDYANDNIKISTSFLKANTEEVAFKSWVSGRTELNNPNNIDEAKAKFAEGAYKNEVYCYVGDDGKLDLTISYLAKHAGRRWVIFNNLNVTYYANRAGVNSLLAQAKELVNNEEYKNITGKERADLQQAITTYSSDDADIETAVNNLNSLISAFIAAKETYDALVHENSVAVSLGVEESDLPKITNETVAADVVSKINDLKVAECTRVKEHFPTAIKLGEWTKEGPIGTMSRQHWDGTAETTYLEQSVDAYGWGSWEITYSQTINLPAGEYVFKMTGRHGHHSSLANEMALIVKDGDTEIGSVNDFPIGDTGLGVNTAGITSFDPADAAGFANNGNGRGWQWRYVAFKLDEPKAITVMINAKAWANKQWCSFCDYSVVTTADNNIVTIDENETYVPEAKTANVILTRSFVEGWNGLVLPFGMTTDAAKSTFGATAVKDFTGITVAEEGTTLNFTDATEIQAGKPVMIKFDAAPAAKVFTIANAELSNAVNNVEKTADEVKYTFTGTYEKTNLNGQAFTLINGYSFYNYDGTESDVNAKAFRAYFLNGTSAAAKSSIVGFNLDGETNGISDLKVNGADDNNYYDLQGRRVMTPAKGLYIKNGKKVIVK